MQDDDENKEVQPTDLDANVSVSAGADGRETIYVTHPVLPEVKKAIVSARFRILSAEFAPEGAIIYSGTTGEPEGEYGEYGKEGEPSEPAAKPRRTKKA